LIAGKQRKLKDWKYSPEDHRELPIWPTYLEGVEEWREFYTKDFPKHYRANAAVYKCKLKKYKVSFLEFERILVTLMQFISIASDNYLPASHQKIRYNLDLDYLWLPHQGRPIPLGEILSVSR